jgi:CrcB protein
MHSPALLVGSIGGSDPEAGESSRSMTTLLVAIGGVLGVLARYGLSRLTLHHESLIWTTVGINIAGSFLLGVLAAEPWFSRDIREGIGVGFLGGFTTFSTFSVQIVLEVDAGQPWRGAAYLAASVVGGIAAAAAGFALGRAIR